MSQSKNHTTSKIVAKAILRIAIILLLFPAILYFTQPEMMTQRVSFPTPWAIIFPILLLLIFIMLLITVLKNKYTKTEYNWLFTLAGIFTCLYLILFYTKILSLF